MPRVRVNIKDGGRRNGQTTVSGIHYRALRSIATFAAIHAHESVAKKQGKKKLTENDEEALAYYKSVLVHVQALEEAILEGIANTFPPKPPKPPPTKAERWEAVRRSQKEEQLLEMMLESARKERHAST